MNYKSIDEYIRKNPILIEQEGKKPIQLYKLPTYKKISELCAQNKQLQFDPEDPLSIDISTKNNIVSDLKRNIKEIEEACLSQDVEIADGVRKYMDAIDTAEKIYEAELDNFVKALFTHLNEDHDQLLSIISHMLTLQAQISDDEETAQDSEEAIKKLIYKLSELYNSAQKDDNSKILTTGFDKQYEAIMKDAGDGAYAVDIEFNDTDRMVPLTQKGMELLSSYFPIIHDTLEDFLTYYYVDNDSDEVDISNPESAIDILEAYRGETAAKAQGMLTKAQHQGIVALNKGISWLKEFYSEEIDGKVLDFVERHTGSHKTVIRTRNDIKEWKGGILEMIASLNNADNIGEAAQLELIKMKKAVKVIELIEASFAHHVNGVDIEKQKRTQPAIRAEVEYTAMDYSSINAVMTRIPLKLEGQDAPFKAVPNYEDLLNLCKEVPVIEVDQNTPGKFIINENVLLDQLQEYKLLLSEKDELTGLIDAVLDDLADTIMSVYRAQAQQYLDDAISYYGDEDAIKSHANFDQLLYDSFVSSVGNPKITIAQSIFNGVVREGQKASERGDFETSGLFNDIAGSIASQYPDFNTDDQYVDAVEAIEYEVKSASEESALISVDIGGDSGLKDIPLTEVGVDILTEIFPVLKGGLVECIESFDRDNLPNLYDGSALQKLHNEAVKIENRTNISKQDAVKLNAIKQSIIYAEEHHEKQIIDAVNAFLTQDYSEADIDYTRYILERWIGALQPENSDDLHFVEVLKDFLNEQLEHRDGKFQDAKELSLRDQGYKGPVFSTFATTANPQLH